MSEPPIWSKSRWALILASLTVGQAAALTLLSRHPSSPAPQPRPLGHVLLVSGTRWDKVVLDSPLVRDPVLLARVHRHSFTGPLWLTASNTYHRMAEWTEPAPMYVLDPFQPGEALHQFLATNAVLAGKNPAFRRRAGYPLVESPALDGEAPIPALILTGKLEHRELLSKFDPQTWHFTNAAKATVLSVGVSPSGFVEAVRLISNSLPSADQAAIRWAKTARFKPLDSMTATDSFSLARGRLIFHWIGQPPPKATKPSPPHHP